MNTGKQDRISEADRGSIGTIDAVGWGVFFIWVGLAIVADVGWGLALLGTGVISLGGQLARRLLGLPVNRWGVAFGGCLAVAGLVQWIDIPVGSALRAWLFPAAFMALGAGILVSTWVRHRH